MADGAKGSRTARGEGLPDGGGRGTSRTVCTARRVRRRELDAAVAADVCDELFERRRQGFAGTRQRANGICKRRETRFDFPRNELDNSDCGGSYRDAWCHADF